MSQRVGAVVIGAYANGLETVRSLGIEGIPTAVIVTRSTDIAQYSRWAVEGVSLPDFHRKPSSLIDLLDQRCSDWKGWVLFPTNDDSLVQIARNSEKLSRHFRLISPPWEITRPLVRKDLIYQTAQELGIDLPVCYGSVDSRSPCDEIEYPVIVKPLEGHRFYERFGSKLFFARGKDELRLALGEVERSQLDAHVYDFVPGPDSHFHNYSVYMDRNGEPVAEFSMKKIRKSPPLFGVCRVAETGSKAPLREPTIEMLRRIGWHGMANAEYKLDPRDGRYRLMEINGRCFLMQGLARRGGVNYPLLAWKEAVSMQQIGAQPNDWQGVWIHLHADLIYSAAALPTERLGARGFFSPYSRPKTFAVWNSRDPKPFAMQWWKSALILAKAFTSPKTRSWLRSRMQGIGSSPPSPKPKS